MQHSLIMLETTSIQLKFKSHQLESKENNTLSDLYQYNSERNAVDKPMPLSKIQGCLAYFNGKHCRLTDIYFNWAPDKQWNAEYKFSQQIFITRWWQSTLILFTLDSCTHYSKVLVRKSWCLNGATPSILRKLHSVCLNGAEQIANSLL